MEQLTSAKPAHTSLPITREVFEQGKLKRESYSTEEISKALVDYLSRTEEELTARQKKAMRKYEKSGCWSIGKPLNVKDVKCFYETSNDIFFNGFLRKKGPVTILSGNADYIAMCVPTENVLFVRQWLLWGERKKFAMGKEAHIVEISRLAYPTRRFGRNQNNIRLSS
jgi:hypothetical protein